MRTVSDSEVQSYLKCERHYMFNYAYNFTPKDVSQPLQIGNIGHEVLAKFYEGKKEGLPHVECVQRGMSVTANYLEGDFGDAVKIVAERFIQYSVNNREIPYKILSVEKPYVCPLVKGELGYLFVPDLVFELPTGEIEIWEHKWGFNFWTSDDVYDMNQLVKYMWGMQQLGYRVKRGVVNQLRYRHIKEPKPSQVFKRDILTPTKERLENIADEHTRAALRIVELPRKEIQKKEAIPARNKINCKDCFFRPPCRQMTDGTDPNKTLAIFFKQRERPRHNA